MTPYIVDLVLAGIVVFAVACDVSVRWVRRRTHVFGYGHAHFGLLPLPVLAVFSGLSTVITGWVGWALLIVAAVAAVNELNHKDGLQASHYEVLFVNRALVALQLALIAVSLKVIHSVSMTLYFQ